MRLEKETRPLAWRQGRGHQDPHIVSDFKPFVAYYAFIAFILLYAAACFVRDMGW